MPPAVHPQQRPDQPGPGHRPPARRHGPPTRAPRPGITDKPQKQRAANSRALTAAKNTKWHQKPRPLSVGGSRLSLGPGRWRTIGVSAGYDHGVCRRPLPPCPVGPILVTVPELLRLVCDKSSRHPADTGPTAKAGTPTPGQLHDHDELQVRNCCHLSSYGITADSLPELPGRAAVTAAYLLVSISLEDFAPASSARRKGAVAGWIRTCCRSGIPSRR
jgi:hypothetical protein